MQEQEQIKKEEENEDDDIDMNDLVKDIKDMSSRVKNCTSHVQGQDQRIVGINEKLDDYNKEVKTGDKYMDVINKGPLTYLKDKFFGFFSFKKSEQLSNKDRKTIENAKNKQSGDNKNDDSGYSDKDMEDWYIVGQDSNKVKTEDDVINEAINEVKNMRANIKEFGAAVKDSTKLVDATNNNMDVSIKNTNKVNKKMRKNLNS